MSELHFLRPLWWLALIPLLWAVVRLLRLQVQQHAWRGLVDDALAPYVLVGSAGRARAWPSVMMAVCGLLAIVALAGPVWEKQPAPVFRAEHKMVMVLDLSLSMNATDIKPSRLARARFKIGDLLDAFPDLQSGLVVFSEVPYVISPVTDDADTVTAFLDALSPELMPVQGGKIGPALRKAGELLQRSQAQAGATVLLLTDSSLNGEAFTAARELRAQGYTLSVLGVGTAQGGPVRLQDGSLLKDAHNHIVVPPVDLAGLRDLAASGGGRFSELRSDDQDIHALVTAPERDGRDEAGQQYAEQWIEYGAWLMLPMAVVLLSVFRRGVL